VGLKHDLFPDDFFNFFRQQSHHCGIETRANRKTDRSRDRQQSHHCGIETPRAAGHLPTNFCSNRTIVGLKQGLDFEEIMREVMQQSHHCGIETLQATGGEDTWQRQQSHHCGIETLSRN